MTLPLYRLILDGSTLLQTHPPLMRHPHKAMLVQMAYPDGVASAGSIEVTRWAESVDRTFDLSKPAAIDLRPDFFDYKPLQEPLPATEWHVNFADPQLFVAYGSQLLAQDEMQVVEHPLLASVREALIARKLSTKTEDDRHCYPILVTNVERRLELETAPDASQGRPEGIYGNRFAAASEEVVRRAVRPIEPPTFSNIIAMAAPLGGSGEYTEWQLAYIFLTAYTSFVAARLEAARLHGAGIHTVIHSGLWGCGAFGGNRTPMIALQALAASAAKIDRLVLHCADEKGCQHAAGSLDVARGLQDRCGTSFTLDTLIGRTVMLGYRWGTSDGN